MHINLESDYAVRLVHTLARKGERMDAASLAEASNVSLRFTLKIMQKLGAAEIVQSFKGSRGGYTLRRPPQEITLREVIEAVEGQYRFSRCVGGGYDCACHGEGVACPFQTVFDEITRMVVEKLDATTFDRLL